MQNTSNKVDFLVIEIEKIQELPDAWVKNNIPVGRIKRGVQIKELFEPPTIDQPFIISNFITSPVQEIIDDHTFKTWNSIYTWKII